MALTKVGKEGVVGLDNSADATAITITSAENVGFGTASPTALSNYTSVVANNSTGSMFELMVGGTRTANMQTSASAMNIQTRTSIPMIFDTNSTEAMKIDANGIITQPLQPAFMVHPSTTQSNLPINTTTTIVFPTERFDNNADFASNTFTAPVTGKYQLQANMRLDSVDKDYNNIQLYITTSNKGYYSIIQPAALNADAAYWFLAITVLADMDASDTAYVGIYISNNGAAQMDVDASSFFSGYLVC